MTLIMDVSVVALRVLLPIYAIIIVYQCFASMRRRRRPERPLVLLQDTNTGVKIPVLFWENSIGRASGSDIAVDDPAVSRGTYLNGRQITRRAQVRIDDVITIGNTNFAFRRGEEYHEELKSSWFFSKVVNKPSIQPYKIMILVSLFHVFMGVEAIFCDAPEEYGSYLNPAVLCGVYVAVEWAFFAVSTLALKRSAFEIESLCLFMTGIGVMLLARQITPGATLQPAYVQLAGAVIGMALFCFIVSL